MRYYQDIQDAILNGYGRERSFLCHVHGDSNPSASVNSETGLWICYACHAKGKIDLESLELDPYSVKRQVTDALKRLEEVETVYPESWLNLFDAQGPGDYWLSRFSPEVCRRHRLGLMPGGKSATIPLRNWQGQVTGLVTRDLTESGARYRYPRQAKLSERLYGYHMADKDALVLVEGATDVVAYDEVSPGHAMALYGNRLSRTQAKLIGRYSPGIVLVATDQDKAGELAYQSIRQRLYGLCPVVRVVWDEYKDLASIPVEDRADLVEWITETYDLPRKALVG